MKVKAKWLAVAACLMLAGCPNSSNNNGNDDGNNTKPLGLSGKISAPGAGRVITSLTGRTAADTFATNEGYQVIAVSNQTGETYRGTTDAAGNFQVDIPEAESGNTFVVTLLGQDGQAVGPVMYGQLNGSGMDGLALSKGVSLGTIEVPANPAGAPLAPGEDADADLDLQIDPSATVRLNDQGMPVGLASHGKGAEAQAQGQADPGSADGDGDGLVNMVDADDDGDGTVDDFDADANMNGGIPDWLRVNFFMNLKIQAEQAAIYYAGAAQEIADRLAQDTVITFEVFTEPSAPKQVTSAHVLEVPGPTYLPISTILGQSGQHPLWSASNYAFSLNDGTGRYEAFVVPMAVMNSGDTFTAEISFDDNTGVTYSRMINYVFKNIPRLIKYGTEDSLINFDVNDVNVNGGLGKPIPIDTSKDLVLVFNPPKDETGAYLTRFGYSFQMFYYDGNGGQLNQEIDKAATWPAPVPGFGTQNLRFDVALEDLTLSPENTYTFTIPKEVFPAVVKTNSGDKTVSQYKVDITAESSSGNAAIMLAFKRAP